MQILTVSKFSHSFNFDHRASQTAVLLQRYLNANYFTLIILKWSEVNLKLTSAAKRQFADIAKAYWQTAQNSTRTCVYHLRNSLDVGAPTGTENSKITDLPQYEGV